MNDDIKKLIEEKAWSYGEKNNESCACRDDSVGKYQAYTAGATEFYRKAIEDCIKVVIENSTEHHRFVHKLQQLKKGV